MKGIAQYNKDRMKVFGAGAWALIAGGFAVFMSTQLGPVFAFVAAAIGITAMAIAALLCITSAFKLGPMSKEEWEIIQRMHSHRHWQPLPPPPNED